MCVHARGGAASPMPHSPVLGDWEGTDQTSKPSVRPDLLGTSNNSRLKSADFQHCLTRFLSSLGQRDWKTEEEIQKKQVWVIKLLNRNCCHLGSPSTYHLLFHSNSPVRQSRDSQQLPGEEFVFGVTQHARCDVEGTQHRQMEYAKENQLWAPPAPLGAGTEALGAGHSKGTSWISVASPSVHPSTK